MGAASSISAARMRAKPFVFGKRFCRRAATGRLMTPGVDGVVLLAGDASSPLSLPLERCRPSVPRAKLSRLLRAAVAQLKYPALPFVFVVDSILRIGGGDVVRGEAMLLYPLPLALLELFLFRLVFLLCSLVFRIVFMSEA